MRTLSVTVLVFGLLLASVGCDSSNDEDRSDAEIFVATWQLATLRLDGADASALLALANVEDVEVLFENDGGFTMTVITSDNMTTTVQGTYVLDDNQKTITFDSDSFETAVMLNYEIENDNRIVLNSNQVTLLSALAGINLEDLQVNTLALILQRKS